MKAVWACEECGWEWPLFFGPPDDAECDNCGGALERVPDRLVAVVELIKKVSDI